MQEEADTRFKTSSIEPQLSEKLRVVNHRLQLSASKTRQRELKVTRMRVEKIYHLNVVQPGNLTRNAKAKNQKQRLLNPRQNRV